MPRGLDGLRWAIWTIAIVALVFILREASRLLIPIVLAVLISYALEPVVAWFTNRGLPRIAAASLLMLVLLGASGWTAYSLRDDALQALEALPATAERIRGFVWSGRSAPGPHVQRAAEALSGASAGTPEASGEKPGPMTGEAIGGWVQGAVGSVVALAGHFTVIVFLVFFLLISGGHFRTRIVEIAGPRLEQRRITAQIIDDINAQIQRFLLVRLFTAVVVAAATWVVLAWMGVPQAAVWAVLAGAFNSIPYFGPVIVTGGLLLVSLVQSGDFGQALAVAGAALAITSLEGWLLTPPLLGRSQHMHVIVVFLGVLLWSWIWGPWGTITAVPMLVIAKSIADHVESLKPMSQLMGR